ncbi:hypothetical protein BHM03_00051441 [Ensete ventricosum]|nr:hypothetical protein BHM03_00051441 [Ensete ventricosum]
MGAWGFFISAKEMCKLLGTSVSCDISRGVTYPRSGDLVWLASIGGVSLFASASFHSSCGSPVVDVSTKTVVKGARYYHDSAPPMVKLAR